jgi:hypothetical protein
MAVPDPLSAQYLPLRHALFQKEMVAMFTMSVN